MPCWDSVLTVTHAPSSPAPQTMCLAAGISDSASLRPSGTRGEGGGWPGSPSRPGCTPAPAGVWGMVVLDKRASKLLEPLTLGGWRGRLQLWPVTSVLATSLRSSRPRRPLSSLPCSPHTPTPTRGSLHLGTSVRRELPNREGRTSECGRGRVSGLGVWRPLPVPVGVTTAPCRGPGSGEPVSLPRKPGTNCLAGQWLAARCLFIYDVLLTSGTAIPTCSPRLLVMHE